MKISRNGRVNCIHYEVCLRLCDNGTDTPTVTRWSSRTVPIFVPRNLSITNGIYTGTVYTNPSILYKVIFSNVSACLV